MCLCIVADEPWCLGYHKQSQVGSSPAQTCIMFSLHALPAQGNGTEPCSRAFLRKGSSPSCPPGCVTPVEHSTPALGARVTDKWPNLVHKWLKDDHRELHAQTKQSYFSGKLCKAQIHVVCKSFWRRANALWLQPLNQWSCKVALLLCWWSEISTCSTAVLLCTVLQEMLRVAARRALVWWWQWKLRRARWAGVTVVFFNPGTQWNSYSCLFERQKCCRRARCSLGDKSPLSVLLITAHFVPFQ